MRRSDELSRAHSEAIDSRERIDQRSGPDVIRGLLIDLAAGLLGLAPWLVTGARLPLQNLWATIVAPGRMPIALLPLSQYSLVTIVPWW